MAEKIDIIKKIMEEARKHLPEVTDEMLEDNGAIFYMNSNDGTTFDWKMNDRLCEFFMFYKDGSKLGFIKIYINKDNTVDYYVYPDQGHGKPIHIHNSIEVYDSTASSGFAKEFAVLMHVAADSQGKYDENIESLDFDVKISAVDEMLFTDYEEDEW